MALRTLKIIVCGIGLVLIAGGGAAVWAEPERGANRGESLVAAKTIEEVLSLHARDLLAIPGVVGVAQGRRANRACLLVFVNQKTPELEKKIPATLEGYPVVIEETGEIRALPEKARDKDRR